MPTNFKTSEADARALATRWYGLLGRAPDAQGLRVNDNTFIECSPCGVMAYQDNIGMSIVGNTAIDPWSTTNGDIPLANFRIKYNQGTVSGNTLIRGTKTATHVCKRGLSVAADTGNRATVGPNDFFAATEIAVNAVRGYIQDSHTVGLSNDNGDAGIALTYGTDAEVQFWSTTLTANRTITLTAALQVGAMFRIHRTGGGAYTLDVGGLTTLLQNQWCDVQWGGTAWILTARGSLV